MVNFGILSGNRRNIVFFFFFFQAEDGIRDYKVTGVQTCALPISLGATLISKTESGWSRPFTAYSPSGCAVAASGRRGSAVRRSDEISIGALRVRQSVSIRPVAFGTSPK